MAHVLAWLGFLGQLARVLCEIGMLTLLIYSVLFFLRGTRAAPILAGISIVVLAMWLVSRSLGLEVIEWLLMKMWAVLAFSVLIIFQPEIRRALAETGTQLMLGQAGSRDMREMLNALLDSTFFLAERRLGALIILQQKIGMRALAETGTILNAPLSQELLTTFFFPNTPLHDGGVIIKDSTVVAAGCIFPLTHDPDMAKSLGTRHRAGVGVTEETDAVAIIVSEETGAISLAHKGRLLRGLNRQRLERHLSNLLLRSKPSGVRSGLSQMLAMFRGPNPPPAEEEVSLL